MSDLRVSVEEVGAVRRNLSVEVPRKLYDAEYSRMLSTAAQRASIKGFRQGKAPRDVVAKLYGGQIKGEVLEKLVADSFRDAVKDKELKVVGKPQIHLDPVEETGDIKFKAEVWLFPTLELKNHLGVEAAVELEEFNEELIKHQLEHVREHHRKFTETDRVEAALGDKVAFGYKRVGADDGATEQEEEALLNPLHPGPLEKQMVGQKIGESREMNFSSEESQEDEVPADDAPKQTFIVTLKRIMEGSLPELTEEFATTKLGAESLAALKSDVERGIRNEIEHRNRQKREVAVLDGVVAKQSFEVPQPLIDEEIREMLFEGRMLDRRKKESFEYDMTPFRERMGEVAEKRVRRGIVFDAVMKAEKISADSKDVEEWIASQAAQFGKSVEAVRAELKQMGAEKNLEGIVARKKCLDLLISKSKLKETLVPAKPHG